jgi:hypothetical protein
MSTEQNSQELNDLKSLWQQTTTTDSLKIKEREMLREMQRDMDTFDEKYGFGTWKQVILTGLMSVMMILMSMKQTLQISKSIFLLLAIMSPIQFIFHLWTKLEKRKYDLCKTEDYYAYNLERVRRQMTWLRYSSGFFLGGCASLYAGYWDEISADLTFHILLLTAFVFGSIYGVWQYKYRLIPLRNNLRDALFDIRNPYPTQNDENS